MVRPPKHPAKTPRTRPFVLGPNFAAISEVEGIRLSGDMKARAADARRAGISPEEYRRTIVRSHRKG